MVKAKVAVMIISPFDQAIYPNHNREVDSKEFCSLTPVIDKVRKLN